MVIAAALLSVAGRSAEATSCVGWPDDVAEQFVRGYLPRPTRTPPEPVAEQFDYALIGDVTAVHGPGPLNDLPGFDRGVAVEVAVRAGFFAPTLPRTVTLSMSDAGALNGYPFEVGRRYFIPVQVEGPDDLSNYVMVCNPVVLIEDDDAQGKVLAAARAAGTTISTIGPASTVSTHQDTRPAPLLLAGAATVVLALGLVLGFALARRRAKAVLPR